MLVDCPFVAGGIVGFALLVMRVSSSRVLRTIVKVYIEIFQGTPLLMQLFLVFFGLPLLGVEVQPWIAATVGLTLFTSAYLAEIWRGCVEAIPKGQWEASSSLAMNYFEQLRHVILPQATRIAIGPTVGFGVQAVKDTALVSIIGFTELTKAGAIISSCRRCPRRRAGSTARCRASRPRCRRTSRGARPGSAPGTGTSPSSGQRCSGPRPRSPGSPTRP